MDYVALLTALLFFLVSIIASVVGIGGGVIYNPVMLFLGYDLKTVVLPVSLFIIFLTALSSTYGYYRQKLIDFKMGLIMGATALIGAPFGAFLAHILPDSVVVFILSSLILLVAVRLLFKSKKTGEPNASGDFKGNYYAVGLPLGFVSAVIASLTGVGGGAIMGPVLILAGYDAKKSVATTSLGIVFISFFGFLSYIPKAELDAMQLILFGTVVLIGAQIGSRILSPRLKSSYIQTALAVILIMVAIELVLKFLSF